MLWITITLTGFFTFCGLVLAMRFRMTEASMDIVRAQLDERRAAKRVVDAFLKSA